MNDLAADFPSLTIRRISDGWTIAGNENTRIEDIGGLLNWLPEDSELRFYDQFYPSMSDPGAYVSIQRRGDAFIYLTSNHGWSSEWKKISMELTAQWISINLSKNQYLPDSDRDIKVSFCTTYPWEETHRIGPDWKVSAIILLTISNLALITWIALL